MIPALVALLVVVLVVGLIAWLLTMLVDMLPADPRFRQIAKVLIMVIAILIVIMKALPLLGVSAV